MTKTLHYFIPLFFFCLSSMAQEITFTDGNFKSALLQSATTSYIAINEAGDPFKIDANNDGEIQINEAMFVHRLFVINREITSLSGIEFFANLKELNCSYNFLSTLPLAGLNELEHVSCTNNQLTELGIQNLPDLAFVDCSDNLLQSLNLSGLPSLTMLNCYHNELTALEVSQLPNLVTLYCFGNRLTTLDLSSLQHSVFAQCHDNSLVSVNIENGFADTIYFENNPGFSFTCADDFERNNLEELFDIYGYPNAEVRLDCTLETENFSNATAFAIYPNPANDRLNIRSKRNFVISDVTIYNTLGQLVLVDSNFQQNKSIDVSTLKTGNYFIKINSDQGISNAKFIKK